MRLDHRRDRAVALLIVALLSATGGSTGAIAQGPAGRGGYDPGGYGQDEYGPGGYDPGGGQPGQPQPGQAEDASAGRASPVDLDAVPTDTEPLARFVPGEATGLYFEFPGLNAAPDVWRDSSAHRLLNETSLGEMIRELVSQAVEVAPDAPARAMTGPEVAAVGEHIARHGLVVASPRDGERGNHYVVAVLRNAAHREVRGLFGKLIGTIARPGTDTRVVGKAGDRQVVVMDSPAFGLDSGDWAWWIEGDDLVFVFNGSDSVDRVIAAISGEEPNAIDDPLRQELMAADGPFQPLAFGSWRLDRPGAGPGERSLVDEHGLTRILLRWGFDGDDSLSVVQLDAPAPRKGMMTAFDQPAIPLAELPPIPTDAGSVSVLSLDLTGLFDALLTLGDQGNPALSQQVRAFEQTVRDRSRLNLRDDVLAALGPKIAVYTLPKPAPRPAGGNPLAGVMNALGGLGLPQFVVAIELRDASAFTSKLDGLILAINQQIGSALALLEPEPEEAPAPGPGGPPRGQGADRRPPARPEPPKFSMTLAEPRTFLLRLPEGLYGLTGYQPTITLGKQHLIFATTPVAARQCRELEAAPASNRWAPGGELAGTLPGDLTMLFVDDPTQSFPAAIASLPAKLNAALVLREGPRDAAQGGAPGMASGGRPPEYGGGFSAEGVASDPGGYGGGGYDEYGGAGGYGGEPGAPAGGPPIAAPTSIRIPPELIPTTDVLRSVLSPSLYSVSVDDAGIRVEARETLPGQWGLSGLGTGPGLTLPIPGLSGRGPGGGN